MSINVKDISYGMILMAKGLNANAVDSGMYTALALFLLRTLRKSL